MQYTCNLISLKGIQLDKPLRPSSPHSTASASATKEATRFLRPDLNTKMHAFNLEYICNVLEILDCCEIIHFVTIVVALLFYSPLRHATGFSNVK